MSPPLDSEFSPEVYFPTSTGETIPMRAARRRAKDLLCSDIEGRILLRDEGSAIAVHRYYRPSVIQGDPEHYSLAVADNTPEEKRKRRFLVLSNGVFTLEAFPATGEFVIPKNTWMKEPRGPGLGSWIVCDDPVLAADFERKLFGGTLDELTQIARAFQAAVVGPLPKRGVEQVVRLALSKKQDHQCTLTGALIPKAIPFVNFDGSTVAPFGRVSLSGFYRQLAFLCRGHDEAGEGNDEGGPNRMFSGLVEHGADPGVLSRLCDIGTRVSKRALLHWSTAQVSSG